MIFGYIGLAVCILTIFAILRKNDMLLDEENNGDEVYSFIKTFGGSHVSHLAFLNDKKYFWNSTKRVLMIYEKVGNKLVVLGDPLGDVEQFESAILEFHAFGREMGLKPTFYQVTPDLLPVYEKLGYKFLKLGEEAKVNLHEFSLAGKKGAKLRTRKNKFDRNGYQSIVVKPPYTKEFLDELNEISLSWLDGRKEKGYSVGFFSEEYVSSFPIALLLNPEGETIAFATLAHDFQKEDKTITIDLMRYYQDNPHGTMEILFLHIFNWCKENGYDWCSLGMVPLANVGNCSHASNTEKLYGLSYKYGNRFYNFKGLQEYKNKFYPNWENRYLAYRKSFLPIVIIQLIVLIHKPKRNIQLKRFLPAFRRAS